MSKAVLTVHGFLTDIKDFGRLYDYLDFYDEVVPYKVPGHNDGESFDKFYRGRDSPRYVAMLRQTCGKT